MLFVGARQQPSKRRVEKKTLHRLTFVRSLLCAKTENTFRELGPYARKQTNLDP